MNKNGKEMFSLNEMGDAVLMSNDPASGTTLQIYAEGRRYKTTYTRKFAERIPYKAPNPNEIRSYIPGEVAQIVVKRGDRVKKGDTLMIYEAMKMKNIISAPFDAKVAEILVKEGDKLPKGALLMNISNFRSRKA